MRSASSPRAVSMITGSSERARISAELEPVDPWEHDVEDDEVGRILLEEPARGASVLGLLRRIAGSLEIADRDVAHDRLVVDHENGRHRHIVRARPCRGVK